MPDLSELEAQRNAASNGPARVFDLRTRAEIHLPNSNNDMQQAPAGQSGNEGNAPPVVDSIERQLAQMQKMAAQLFPDDEIARKECLVRLLNERLQTLEVMLRDAAGRFLSLAIREMR